MIHYAYFALANLNLARLTADSAVPGLNRNHAHMERIIMPPDSLLTRFEAIVSPFFSRMHLNDLQGMTIAAIRDTLLPQLLSGELSIGDPQEFMEHAV